MENFKNIHLVTQSLLSLHFSKENRHHTNMMYPAKNLITTMIYQCHFGSDGLGLVQDPPDIQETNGFQLGKSLKLELAEHQSETNF